MRGNGELRKRLGEQVCGVVLCGAILQVDLLPYKVVLDLYVFGLGMKYEIARDRQRVLTVTSNDGGLLLEKLDLSMQSSKPHSFTRSRASGSIQIMQW